MSVGVDHGDYLPSPSGVLNARQYAAARFANATLAGITPLKYAKPPIGGRTKRKNLCLDTMTSACAP